MPRPERWTPVPESIDDLPPEEIKLPEKPERHLRLVNDEALKLERRMEENGIKKTQDRPLLENSLNTVEIVQIVGDGKGIFKPVRGEEPIMDGIEVGTYFKRERAAYVVDQFFGFDLVPPTVIRVVDEDIGSIQQFRGDALHGSGYNKKKSAKEQKNLSQEKEALDEEYLALRKLYYDYDAMIQEIRDIRDTDALKLLEVPTDLMESRKEISRTVESLTDLKIEKNRLMDLVIEKLDDVRSQHYELKERVKETTKEETKREMIKLWLFDMVVQNNDRHSGNYMYSPDGGIIAIDNGLAFGGSTFRLARSFFNEEIPGDIAEIILNIQGQENWEDQLAAELEDLLSEKEIKACIERIDLLIGALENQKSIPNEMEILDGQRCPASYFDLLKTAI